VDADQPQVIVTLKLEIDGIPVDALPPVTDASEYLTAEEAASYIGCM
jgi:hypothetical protein